MNDVEKIVLFFFINRVEKAPAGRIQRWAMLTKSRLDAAFSQCGGKVFMLHEDKSDPLGYSVSLIPCPEVDRIVQKHRDLLGMTEK